MSAQELARLAIALLDDGRVDGAQALRPAVVTRILEPRVPMPTEGSANAAYGCGMVLHDRGGLRVAEHGGSMPGFQAELWLVPARRWAILTLVNREGVRLIGTIDKAMETMLGAKNETRARPGEQAMSVDEMTSCAGRYANRWTMELVVRDGALVLKRFNREIPVRKIGPMRFVAQMPGEARADEFLLAPGRDGRPAYMQMFIWAFKRIDATQS
jgi:CubicO group peptidase (beta-lactamase class C family)